MQRPLEPGLFTVRGLVPGPVTVRLVEVPTGATIIGAAEQSVDLAAGSVGAVTFTVEPVRARAQSFTQRSVRIRSVAVERARVPPGSAPIVRVEVAGDADEVVLRYGDDSVALALVDGVWEGRLVLPDDVADGPLAFTAVALAGDAEATRRGQVEVDRTSPVIEVRTNAPVRGGETLRIEAHAVLEFVALAARIGPDLEVPLVEVSAGQWVAEVVIPSDAPDGVAEAQVFGSDGRERAFSVSQSFRVVGR